MASKRASTSAAVASSTVESAPGAARRRRARPTAREAWLEATLASLADVVFTLDREQRHVELFGSWIKSEGLAPEMFLGKTAAEVLGPEAGGVHQEANRRALAGERVCYEWSLPGTDGERWFQTSLAPLFAADGSIDGLSGVAREFTAARRLERQRQAAVAALELSEARYRAIFDGVMVAVWEEDANAVAAALDELRRGGVDDLAGYLLSRPDEVAHLLGLTRFVDANGETLSLLAARDVAELATRLGEIFTPSTWDTFRAALVAFAAGQRSLVVESELRSLDGRLLQTLVKIALPSPAELGKRIVVTVVDLTHLKQVEREREQLIAELKSALTRVKHLSGLLPICSRCKKIRDDDGYWQDVAVYLRDHTGTDFTHGICPGCYGELYADLDNLLPPR